MPKIGLSMLFCLGKPFSALLKHLKAINVSYVELVDEGLHALNIKRVNTLKEIAHSKGLKLSLHAPFADINIASPNPNIRRVVLKRLEKSIAYAHKLQCETWVFHPGLKTGVSYFYPNLDWRTNLESTRKLLEAAEEQNVKIAVENVPEPFPFLMKNVDDFSRFFNELNEDNLGFVLDIGHANINQQIYDFIKNFSEKIVHIHASDNDGKNDLHRGIGYGTVDWEKVAHSLNRYSGKIIVESVEHVKESVEKMQKLFV